MEILVSIFVFEILHHYVLHGPLRAQVDADGNQYVSKETYYSVKKTYYLRAQIDADGIQLVNLLLSLGQLLVLVGPRQVTFKSITHV